MNDDEAREGRDAGLEQVAENNETFMVVGLRALAEITGYVSGEDVRLALTEKGIVPHHHNAWGALIMAGVRQKLLRPTEREVHMKTKKSHARRTRVYEAGWNGETL